MSPQSVLSKIPALRIVVPFMAGILVHGLWHCWWAPLLLIAVAIVTYIWLSAVSKSPQGRMRWKSFFIIPLAIGALALGWLCAVIHCPLQLTDEQRYRAVMAGRVVNVEYTDFSMRLTVEILDVDLPPAKVLLSTRGCDYTMRAGNLVAWHPALEEIAQMGNPGEMDYAGHLLHSRSIRYQQHLLVDQVKIVGYSPTLLTRMANLRRYLQLMVFNTRLSPGAQQFVVALMLGNSNLIDKATRQEFSAAGVAHVLALSGLHVGFIALLIWWLLFPLDYLGLKKMRLVITLAAIALFAVFTGLSPSVVRATIMIGFVFAAQVFHRRSISLNALAMAALVILVFSPSALYGVGFQLSFITVGAVLILGQVPSSLESKYKVLNRLTSTVIVSIVAMLATVALSAHYFHTVSLMSVLANLLILPVLPMFMALGALFLLVIVAGLQWPVLEWAIDTVYRYIHWAIGAVNSIPLSHVNGVYVSTLGVVIYFVILAFVVLWLFRHNYRYLLVAGCGLVALLGHSLWIDINTPKRGMVIFNSFSSTPILYYDNGKVYVWTPDGEDTDSATFARYYAGFLARQNIDELVILPGDTVVRLTDALFKPPYAHLMGRRILAVGSGKWKGMSADHRMALDDIIVTKRFHGSAAKLRELYDFDRLVISGAMYDTTLQSLLAESDSLGINTHNLSRQGALCFSATDIR